VLTDGVCADGDSLTVVAVDNVQTGPGSARVVVAGGLSSTPAHRWASSWHECKGEDRRGMVEKMAQLHSLSVWEVAGTDRFSGIAREGGGSEAGEKCGDGGDGTAGREVPWWLPDPDPNPSDRIYIANNREREESY